MSGSKCVNSDFVALLCLQVLPGGLGERPTDRVVQQNKTRGDSTLRPCQTSALLSQGSPRRDQHNSLVPLKPICMHHYQEKSHNLL